MVPFMWFEWGGNQKSLKMISFEYAFKMHDLFYHGLMTSHVLSEVKEQSGVSGVSFFRVKPEKLVLKPFPPQLSV